jgi:glucokinase
MADNNAIGIDVGGTNIKAGLVAATGQVLARQSIPTKAENGVEHMIALMAELAGRLRGSTEAAKHPPTAIGLGMPGTLSHLRGIVFAPPNLPGWRNVPVVELLQKATGLRVVLENDANCAAVGEHLCGAGQGARHLVLLTLGTGIGGGLILDGKLWRGADESAGEWGHVIVQIDGRLCNCGQRGCLEAYASASSTAARAVERIRSGQPSSLKATLDSGVEVTAETVLMAAGAGDELAQSVWQETCDYLAIACLNIQHSINPQRIVLAGGMSVAGERLLDPVHRAVERIGSKLIASPPDIRLSRLGNDAGIIGAALTVFLPD